MAISPDKLYFALAMVMIFMTVSGFAFTVVAIRRRRERRHAEIAELRRAVSELVTQVSRLTKA